MGLNFYYSALHTPPVLTRDSTVKYRWDVHLRSQVILCQTISPLVCTT